MKFKESKIFISSLVTIAKIPSTEISNLDRHREPDSTIGSRTTPAVMVGLLMLMESIFAPIWVWLFYNEIPPISVLVGGMIILSAVVMKSLDYIKV